MTKNLKKNYLTNEELVINILINDIYKLEEQIKSIMKKDNNYNINNNVNNSKIYELKKNRNILKEKIRTINNKNKDEIDCLKTKINTKKNIINESSEKISEYKRIINSYNTLNFKNINKDIAFNRKNEFLTNEQIDDILYKSCNSEDTDKIMKKIQINKASENFVMNNINMLNDKISNIKEILLMLNEDKICINEDLVNLISCKESLDNIIKYISLNLNKCILNHFNNINDESKDSNILLDLNRKANIEIYYYEILTLDINIASIKLCKELFEIFDLNNRNEIYKYPETYKNWKRSKSIKLNSPIINNITKIYQSLSNFPHIFYTNRNEESVKDNNIESIGLLTNTNTNIYRNKKDYKKSFIIIIKKEINNFINMKKKIKVKNFLENLSIILINKLKNYNVFLPSSEILILYLSFFFKILYYENMIDKYFNFINKEYEIDKNKVKELISAINNELSKLKIKEEEINDEKMINEEKLKFIKNNNFNYLLQNEQNYIQICLKANELIKRNEILNEEIISEENNINQKKIMIKNKKNVINHKINIIDKKIEEIKEYQNKSNITQYQKKILEKYDSIKKQLKLYKNKHNSNLSRYNVIIEDINKIIGNNNKFIKYQECQNYFNQSINKLRNSLPNKYSNFIKDINKEKYRSKTFYQNNRRNNLYDLILNNKNDKLNKKHTHSNSAINKKRKINKNMILVTPNPLSRNIQNYNYSSNYFQSQKQITDRTNVLFDYTTKATRNSINCSSKSKNSNETHSFFYKKNKNKSSSVEESLNNKNIKEYINSFNIKGIRIVKISDLKGKNKINYFRNKNINKKTEIIYYENNKENTNLNLDSKNYKRSRNKSNSSISKSSIKEEYYLSKLNPLMKMTLCYFREINKNSKGYNPLIASDLSYSDLIDYPYNFIKSTITLNKTYNSIKIIPSNKIDSTDININQILNTIVSSEIKIIIDIYREFNKKKDQLSKEEFIKNAKSKYNNNLSNEEIEKCIENKNFNFFLSVSKEKRYEFIVCSYNDFKLWINGLAFIIKNKKDILNAISENNIIK